MNRRSLQRRSGESHPNGGFTLFEVLIAVGLTSLLMVALYSAMNIYFELQLDSHEEISRQQVARAVLRQITRDVQSVVFTEQELLEDEEEAEPDVLDGNAYGESLIDPETVSTTYSSGLVGTLTDLQLFISRPDPQLGYVAAQELDSLEQRAGELMLVRYLLADSGSGGLAGMVADRESRGSDRGPVGLVRMAGDLYGLSRSFESTQDEPQLAASRLLAPEVTALQFRYFDGIDWMEEWDSTELNALPRAIEVVVRLRNTGDSGDIVDDDSEDEYALPETSHRAVIPLPLSIPVPSEDVL
ncbi:MAG: type II secretion system protein GspJ [Planctomycetaceae bacterium]